MTLDSPDVQTGSCKARAVQYKRCGNVFSLPALVKYPLGDMRFPSLYIFSFIVLVLYKKGHNDLNAIGYVFKQTYRLFGNPHQLT